MAQKIEAGAPQPPQNRMQIINAQTGEATPVPEEIVAPKPETEPEPRPIEIGDLVTLKGRVLEIQSPQGGQTSVKVQLDNSAGSVWLRGEHITNAE